jgi:hypothetical protein
LSPARAWFLGVSIRPIAEGNFVRFWEKLIFMRQNSGGYRERSGISPGDHEGQAAKSGRILSQARGGRVERTRVFSGLSAEF